MQYPTWAYFPRNVVPPDWVHHLVTVVAGAEATISTATKKTGLSSDRVLAVLAPGLKSLGYDVETGKKAAGKIKRPVLFGDNGLASVSYEIDAFYPELGVAVEVEAGRGAAGNADYRDIIRMSLMADARYMALLMPLAYRTGKRTMRAYESTRAQMDAIYASQRLRLPLDGVVVVGY